MRPFGPQGPSSGGSVGVPGLALQVDERTRMCSFPREHLEPLLSRQAHADSWRMPQCSGLKAFAS